MRIESTTGEAINSVDDWFRLAPPMGGALQWRDGRSAKELAKAWIAPAGPTPPPAILELLARHPTTADLAFTVAFPERRVRFDHVRGEPRNTDLAIVCEGTAGRVAVSVEAKADESFGKTVGEEIVNAAAQWAFEERDGKLKRLQGLGVAILPPHKAGQASIGALRYQLLTAIAGAWAFASEQEASTAVLVVHTILSPRLSRRRLSQNNDDLDRIAERLTHGEVYHLPAGGLIGPLPIPMSPTWAGVNQWFIGKCETDAGPGAPVVIP